MAKVMSEKRFKLGGKGISEDDGVVGVLAVDRYNRNAEKGNGSKLPVINHLGAQGMKFQLWRLIFGRENIYVVVQQAVSPASRAKSPPGRHSLWISKLSRATGLSPGFGWRLW